MARVFVLKGRFYKQKKLDIFYATTDRSQAILEFEKKRMKHEDTGYELVFEEWEGDKQYSSRKFYKPIKSEEGTPLDESHDGKKDVYPEIEPIHRI